MNVVTLNQKYNAYPYFRFAVIPRVQRISLHNRSTVIQFETLKQWAVSTWGDTPMLPIWLLFQEINDKSLVNVKWTYDINNRNSVPVMRLYFKDQEELSLYLLKWS